MPRTVTTALQTKVSKKATKKALIVELNITTNNR